MSSISPAIVDLFLFKFVETKTGSLSCSLEVREALSGDGFEFNGRPEWVYADTFVSSLSFVHKYYGRN